MDTAAKHQRAGWVSAGLVVVLALAIWGRTADPYFTPKFAVLAAGCAWLAAVHVGVGVRQGRLHLPTNPVAMGMGLFLLLAAVATLASGDVLASAFGTRARHIGLLTYAGAGLVGFTLMRAVVEGRVIAQRWLGGLALAGGLVSLVVLVEGGLGIDILPIQRTFGGAAGTMGNPNFASGFLAIAAVALVWFAVDRSLTTVIRALAGAGVLISVIAMAFARAFQGPVALAAGIVVVLLVRAMDLPEATRRRAFAAIGGATLVGVVLLGLGLAGIGPLQEASRVGTLDARVNFWQTALAMTADQPLTGVGLDQFADWSRSYRPEEAVLTTGFRSANDNAHNVVLQLMATAGAPAGLAYVALAGLAAWAVVGLVRRTSGADRAVVAGLAGVLTAYWTQASVSFDLLPLPVIHLGTVGLLAGMAWPERMTVLGRPAPAVPTGKAKRAKQAAAMPAGSPLLPVIATTLSAAVVLGLLYLGSIPVRAEVENYYAQASLIAEDVDATVRHYDAAHAVAPWEPNYVHMAGVALHDADRLEEAVAKYEEAIAIDERAFSSVFSAARATNSLGDRDRAAELYDRALELEPNHPDLKLEVAQFVLATDQARALALANEVLALVPDSADAQRIAELAEQA